MYEEPVKDWNAAIYYVPSAKCDLCPCDDEPCYYIAQNVYNHQGNPPNAITDVLPGMVALRICSHCLTALGRIAKVIDQGIERAKLQSGAARFFIDFLGIPSGVVDEYSLNALNEQIQASPIMIVPTKEGYAKPVADGYMKMPSVLFGLGREQGL
jgi:hypothetical protein